MVVVVVGTDPGDEGVDDELDDEVCAEIADCCDDERDEQVGLPGADHRQRGEHRDGDRREIRDQSEDGGLGLAHGAESSNGVPEHRCGV